MPILTRLINFNLVRLQSVTNRFASQAGMTGFGTPRNTTYEAESGELPYEDMKKSETIVPSQAGWNKGDSQKLMTGFGTLLDVKGKHLKLAEMSGFGQRNILLWQLPLNHFRNQHRHFSSSSSEPKTSDKEANSDKKVEEEVTVKFDLKDILKQINESIQSVKKDLKEDIIKLDGKIEKLEKDLKGDIKALDKRLWNFMLTIFGAILTSVVGPYIYDRYYSAKPTPQKTLKLNK